MLADSSIERYTVRGLWHELSAVALDLMFPARCVGCGRSGDFLCTACRATLQPIEPPFCRRCGRPLSDGGTVCHDCRTAPLAIAGIRSAYCFQGAIRKAVHELKYSDVTALARPLSHLVAPVVERLPAQVDAVVAVPLHSSRLRSRGYNQAELLARELARSARLPVLAGAVHRVRDTPSQVKVGGREARRANVRGAFRCDDGRVHGKRILLLDDVCTTGSTLSACAEALSAAGAASVWGVTVAREL